MRTHVINANYELANEHTYLQPVETFLLAVNKIVTSRILFIKNIIVTLAKSDTTQKPYNNNECKRKK